MRILPEHFRNAARLASLALLFSLAAAPLRAQIPSPDSVLGFHPGDDRKLADWQQVLDYFQKVSAAAPDRVKFEEIGKTTLGKPFVVLTISSAENISHLQHYLEIQQRLADPRGLTDADAEKLITQGRAIVLITCTVHSTEVASTQTSLEYVYKLLTEDTPEHRAILDNVIFLLIPSLNPDGQDMVVKWYRKYLGTPYEGEGPPEIYQPYVGHDDNRDWYMFTQVESQLTVGKVQNLWHPQVVYDVHQMDPNQARMFMPPFLDPVDPNIDPLLVQETNWLGTSMAEDLAAAGKKGVAIQAIYDEWSPSRHYQAYHAGVRVITESASAMLATPVNVPFSSLEAHDLGYNAQERSWNFPDPWMGGEWRLSDIVDYQLIAFEGCLYNVAQNREMVLRNFYHIGKKSVDWSGQPFAFVIPPSQKDVPAAVKLLQTLRFGLVEIYQAKKNFTANGMEYPAGSYVIPMAQPYGRYAKTLLERQQYPDLREYPGGPPKRPYDATAQTLPLLMGVRIAEINAPFDAALEKTDRIELPPGRVEPGKPPYLLRPDSNNAYLAVNRLLQAGARVLRSREAIEDGDQRFPPGTFIIDSPNVSSIAKLGLDVYAYSRPVKDAVPLRLPRVGLYKSYIPNIDEGWTRWLLEQYEFPLASIHDKDIRAGNLNARFDVIIIPSASVAAIVQGIPSLARSKDLPVPPELQVPPGLPRIVAPDEFAGGIGEEGVANLRLFAAQGGEIITLNRASDFAIDKLGVGARDILRGVPPQNFYGPGSILNVHINPRHPLGYGTEENTAVWFERGPAFAPSFLSENDPAGVSIANYPAENPLMSGWLLGAGLIENQSALMDAPLGRGHVILFGFRPQYRGQSYVTYKILFNALMYFEMDAAQSGEATQPHDSQVPRNKRPRP
ncbi:MAG: M14 family zinc carboxypeptidase [Candidatus Acidiferrales bacterium]